MIHMLEYLGGNVLMFTTYVEMNQKLREKRMARRRIGDETSALKC